MKRIEAIIRKTRFEDVKEALLQSDINWSITMSTESARAARNESTAEFSIPRTLSSALP